MSVYLASGKNKTIQPSVSIASVTTGAPLTITTSAAHGLETGDLVYISGVSGNSANGLWAVTVTTSTAFTLNNSRGASSGAGGTVAHVGFVTSSTPIDNVTFPSGQVNFDMEWSVNSMSGTACKLRGFYQDALDTAFLTSQPGPCFHATGTNSYSAEWNSYQAIRSAQAGAVIRCAVFADPVAPATSAAGAVFQFSAWLAGGGL